MALLFDPFSYAKLILCRAEQLGFLAGIFAALATFPSDLVFKLAQESHLTHIIETQKNLALSRRTSCQRSDPTILDLRQ